MNLPIFHDKDYRGYFGILDKLSGRALFVHDTDVSRCNGSIGNALVMHGQLAKLDYANPYHRLRAQLS